MKGSDKWGQGGGPRIRIEVVLAALVVVTLVGVYFYLEGNGLNSGTGRSRDDDIHDRRQVRRQLDAAGRPDRRAEPDVHQPEQRTLLQLPRRVSGDLTFAYFNGTIAYPCGDAPLQSPASEILVNVTAPQSVLSARLLNSSQIGYQQSRAAPPSLWTWSRSRTSSRPSPPSHS